MRLKISKIIYYIRVCSTFIFIGLIIEMIPKIIECHALGYSLIGMIFSYIVFLLWTMTFAKETFKKDLPFNILNIFVGIYTAIIWIHTLLDKFKFDLTYFQINYYLLLVTIFIIIMYTTCIKFLKS